MKVFALSIVLVLLSVALVALASTDVADETVDLKAPATSASPDPTPSPEPPVPGEGVDGSVTPKPKPRASSHEAGTVPWSKVKTAILRAFGRGAAPRMIAAADCETGGDGYQPKGDIGAAGERGPLQIHPGWWRKWPSRSSPLVQSMGYQPDDLFDVGVNAKVGARILAIQGIDAWSCA